MGKNQKTEAEIHSGKRHQRWNVLTSLGMVTPRLFFLWCWTIWLTGTWKKNWGGHIKLSKKLVQKTIQSHPTWLGVFIREVQNLACPLREQIEALEVKGCVCVSLSSPKPGGNKPDRESQAFQACVYSSPLSQPTCLLTRFSRGCVSVNSGIAQISAAVAISPSRREVESSGELFPPCYIVAFSHWWNILFELPHADHRLPAAPHADLKGEWLMVVLPTEACCGVRGGRSTVCTHTKLDTSLPLTVEWAYHAQSQWFK